jgi:hypothetical protein
MFYPTLTHSFKKRCLSGIVSIFPFTIRKDSIIGGTFMKKRNPNQSVERKVAPTYDEEQSFGEDATDEDVKHGDATMVTRLVYDEYDPSEG